MVTADDFGSSKKAETPCERLCDLAHLLGRAGITNKEGAVVVLDVQNVGDPVGATYLHEVDTPYMIDMQRQKHVCRFLGAVLVPILHLADLARLCKLLAQLQRVWEPEVLAEERMKSLVAEMTITVEVTYYNCVS